MNISKEKLRNFPISRRPCIHHIKGRIVYRICTNDYSCGNCEFDQYVDDQFIVHALVKPVEVLEVNGIRVPQGYYFHKGHTWVKMEEGASVLVGIDDFALKLLGQVDGIEAPLLGKKTIRDAPVILLRQGDKFVRFLSPVNGVVTAINPRMRKQGELAVKDPYSDGWVMRVQSGDLRMDLKRLMIHRETEDFIEREVKLLHKMIQEQAGLSGIVEKDIFDYLHNLSWKKLERVFLRT